MNKIPYGRQHITMTDIESVIEVLNSDWLTQGPKILQFEEAFASYTGAKYAIAVSNGTAALHLCTLALGISSTDQVVTTPITFVASANCVKYCGGDVVFCDIDRETYLLDLVQLKTILSADVDRKIKGIISVNFAGRVVDMELLRNLADEFNCWIIEDACHSPGGYFFNSIGEIVPSGSGQYADISVFSFHPVKHITAGEGGMITTNNEELYKKILNLRTHGIQQDPNQKIENHGGWYYEMQELGYNYRMTDFQAALGLSQLKRAELGLSKRKEIAKRYELALSHLGTIKKQPGFIEGHAYHLYVIEVDNRKEIYDYLREHGIFVQIHYVPTHLMPYYKSIKEYNLPNAQDYYSKCLSLPMFPTLTDTEFDYIIETIENYKPKK